MRPAIRLVCLSGLAALSFSSTLEKLTLDEMIAKSTEIVRGRVVETAAVRRGPFIYTQAKVLVYERLKGSDSKSVSVLIPGGSLSGIRQSYAGAPDVQSGVEYVFFLWTGKSGNTQIIGLSQGLLELRVTASGETTAGRGAIAETMLDPGTHLPVTDEPVSVTMSRLRNRVQQLLGRARE